MSSSCAATPSSGLVWTSERSASRTRSRCAGCAPFDHVAEPEVGDDQRCVGLDVRAHHQDVARLQRGVVGEQAEQHLAQHVDLAGGAVAAVHLHRAVIVGQRTAVPGRTVLAAMSDCSQPEQCVGVRSRRRRIHRYRVGGQGALQLAQVAAQCRQQRVVGLRGGWCRRDAGSGCASRASATGRRWGAVATGADHDGWTARRAVRCRWPAAGYGRTGTAARAARRGLLAAGRELWRAGCGGGSASTRAISARQSGGCQLQIEFDITGDIVLPVDEQLRPLLGVGGEQSGEAACHRVAPATPQLGLVTLGEVAEMRGERPAPLLVEAVVDTSSSGQVIASGDHGSSSAVPVISAMSEAGERNAMPAQTPSAPSPRPRTCESRWLSQRSMPRAGTSTSSSANGSGSGSASNAPRPSASRSVRSARWRWSPIDRNDRALHRHRMTGSSGRSVSTCRLHPVALLLPWVCGDHPPEGTAQQRCRGAPPGRGG